MKYALFLLLFCFSVSAETTYTKDAQPVFKNRCSRCHDYMSGRNWMKYEDAVSHKEAIKTKMTDKTMPPDVPMPQSERDILINWVNDGAKK